MCRPKLFYRASLGAALLVLAMLVVTGVCRGGEKERPAKANGETPPAVRSEPTPSKGTPDHEVGLYIFLLAAFLGYHVISRVPPLLHTPLMSATNAISGISLIGSLVVAGRGYGVGEDEFLTLYNILGFIAVACSSTNVVGGFLITDRMLAMFKSERDVKETGWLSERRFIVTGVVLLAGGTAFFWWGASTNAIHPDEVLRYLYIVSAVLFILGLKGLSSPKWARRGMFLAEFGMAVAIIGTLFDSRIQSWGYAWIGAGMLIGSVVGGTIGLRIPMTAVPQRTALSHSLGALAATLVGISEYIHYSHRFEGLEMLPLGFQVVIGGLTFTGSLMAAAKLQELLPGAPITYRGQNVSNLLL
ncbi:MAG: NAD(P)(+) transhydrogenase (Re/Si-specific) subunit beta, partial [Gemmataceae bacterium]|nr:NAD(P)(+) transhydrogenase (Re/Si-specific) subunit beta [Gemmataceae bacterium]